VRLEKHGYSNGLGMKPHLKKQWCIPAHSNAEFVWRIEDVLDVYTCPYDPLRPQICMDETSKQLLRDTRAGPCLWSQEESSVETTTTSVEGL
jgi:hypothetical protein